MKELIGRLDICCSSECSDDHQDHDETYVTGVWKRAADEVHRNQEVWRCVRCVDTRDEADPMDMEEMEEHCEEKSVFLRPLSSPRHELNDTSLAIT